MDLFESFYDFFVNELFTDFNIYVISNERIEKVCSCHKLILVALVPQLQTFLFEDTTEIFLEGEDCKTIKNVFYAVYKDLSDGVDPRISYNLFQIFGFQKKLNLQQSVQQARKEISYDTNLFDYESLEEILQAENKYLSVQLEQPCQQVNKDLEFCACFAVSRFKNGQNIAALISNIKESSDRSCLNILDVLSRLFQVPLTVIFDVFQDTFDVDKLVREHFQSLKDDKISLDQIHLEHKIYNESMGSYRQKSAWNPIPHRENSRMSFKLMDLNQLEVNIHDFVVISGGNIESLAMSSFFDKDEIVNLDQEGKVQAILKNVQYLLGLQSLDGIAKLPLMKALLETHFNTMARGKALQIISPAILQCQIKLTRSRIRPGEKKRTKPAASLTTLEELKCDYKGCGKVFKKKAGWRKHVNYFHLKEGSGVPCEECGIIYQNFYYLRMHKRQSHEEVTCKDCDQTFIGDNELGRHKRKDHLKGNEHICEVCGQGFKMRFYMKRHKRQHHPEVVNSPYFCQECNRHFGTNRKLRDHMTGAHFKTRPYKCRAGDQICTKAFFNVNLRRKHERQVHHLHIYTPPGIKSNKIVNDFE